MKTQYMSSLLALAIAAALPFSAAAAKPELTRHEVASTSAQSQSAPVRRLIVKYREGSHARNNPATATANLNRVLSRSGLSTQALGGRTVSHLRKLGTGHDLFKLPVSVDRASANAILAQIRTDRDVVSVEVDEMMRIVAPPAVKPAAFPDDPPNDTFYSAGYQWHFHAPDGNTNNIDSVANRGGANVAEAWKLADGSGIVVAVIDTGITEHPDIDSSLGDAGYDFITDAFVSGRDSDERAPGGWDLGDWTAGWPGVAEGECGFPAPNDSSSWHGTHVAGTVGAELTNNGIGVAGIAHGGKVLPIRALGHCGGYTSDIADAIVWASGGSVPGVPDNQNPAHVINMSLGGGGVCTVNTLTGEAIALANSRGTVVVVSAGNANGDAANYSPASCPGAVTVAATGIDGGRATSYSNFGQVVDISAPGGSGGNDWTGYVVQARNGGETVPEPVYVYSGMIGTSMSSPHVAGVVALMQGARLDAGLPLLTPDEVVTYLQETVTPFAVTPPSNQPIGPGIVNAAAAVTRAVCVGDDCTPAAPPATPIVNKTPIKGLSGGTGTWVLTVPEGAKGPLNIITSGGKGDLTLLVHMGEAPDDNADWSRRSARRGNSETVRITNPQAGEYYIRLIGEPRAYSGVTLRAHHN